ncbi:hypothetical protein SDC9_162614 [bioreactor metagenome]|uniref:Uncharacterized protein n=1 Tax=bioreactor metagenome TaxID=1076179 RepID=A0A645FT63_9ZZZZ
MGDVGIEAFELSVGFFESVQQIVELIHKNLQLGGNSLRFQALVEGENGQAARLFGQCANR